MRRYGLALALFATVGCVTRAQVCVQVGRDRYGRDGAPSGESYGASVCADVEKR